MQGAISLQDQAFLYVLSRVECYPVSYLARLPKAWRERLLRAVPPIQLYKLNKSAVALGIDTGEIWEEMATLKDSVWATYFATIRRKDELSLSTFDESMTTRFFNYINHLYFMEQNRPYACNRMRELLFTVHKDNLESIVVTKLLKTHVQSLFMHRPPYYLVPFRCPSYSEQNIAQMMVKLGTLPNSLEINMKCVAKHTFNETDTNSTLLGSLRRVRVYCSWNDKGLQQILKQIVRYKSNSMITNATLDSNLESLELFNCNHQNIHSITPLLSPSHGYNHLKCLHISMRTSSTSMRYLPGIIKHQMNSLEELRLTNFEISPNAGIIGTSDYTLSVTLSQLILRPQFRKLILDRFSRLPHMLAANLIQSFLRSIPNHKQTICLKNSQICLAGRVPFLVKRLDPDMSDDDEDEFESASVFHPACTEECTTYKHLVIDNVDLPVEFLEWMNSIDGIYLNTFIMKDISILPKVPPRGRRGINNIERKTDNDIHPGNPFRMLDSHPNMICRNFIYSSKGYQ